MTSELSLVAINGLLIIITIFAQVTLALPQFGLPYLASPRDEGRMLKGISARLDRAANNCLIGFALFAAAVLILNAKGALNANTLLAAQIVVAARVVYVALYAAGIAHLRTLVWMISILATAWLLILAV